MLFKIILFIVVIFFVIRFFSRALLSMFIGNLTNKISQSQHNYHHQNNSRRKEGEVIINASNKSDKKYDVKEGEYVDFEEIKD